MDKLQTTFQGRVDMLMEEAYQQGMNDCYNTYIFEQPQDDEECGTGAACDDATKTSEQDGSKRYLSLLFQF